MCDSPPRGGPEQVRCVKFRLYSCTAYVRSRHDHFDWVQIVWMVTTCAANLMLVMYVWQNQLIQKTPGFPVLHEETGFSIRYTERYSDLSLDTLRPPSLPTHLYNISAVTLLLTGWSGNTSVQHDTDASVSLSGIVGPSAMHDWDAFPVLCSPAHPGEQLLFSE